MLPPLTNASRGSHKEKGDQDWSEELARCADSTRALRAISVPAAIQARSAWSAHGSWDANRANCLSLLNCLAMLRSHWRLPEAVTKKQSALARGTFSAHGASQWSQGLSVISAAL